MADQKTNVTNAFETTLSAPVSSTDLTINVDSTAGSPAIPFYVILDPGNDDKREVVLVDGSKTATTFVLSALSSRGQDGTTAVAHDFGAAVGSYPVAALWTDINDRVDGVRDTLAEGTGYRLSLKYEFGGSSVFEKANWPWLTAVRVRAVGGGGGGGGAQGGSGTAAQGGGGGGGAYAEKRIAVADLLASETITIGEGGAGGDGSAGGAAFNGGNTTFGAHVTAGRGHGGTGMTATTGDAIAAGGIEGNATDGTDFWSYGSGGGPGRVVGGVIYGLTNYGGAAGGIGGGSRSAQPNLNIVGSSGVRYGGGGTGANANSTNHRNGGNGWPGVVYLDLYA